MSARLSAYLALLLNAILWGSAIPIVKNGFNHGLTPETMLIGRFFLAIIFSLPFVIYLIKKNPSLKSSLAPRNLLKVGLLEALGTVFSLYLLYLGLKLTSSIEATIIATTYPILITLGGIFFLREKETRRETVGLSLAFLGSLVLVGAPILSHGLTNSWGNLLVLIQNFGIAAYYLLAKKHYHQQNKFITTHLSFYIGFLGFLLILFLTNPEPIIAIETALVQPESLFAIIYMAIGGSILGLTLYLYGQDKIETSEAALFNYLHPIFAVPVAYYLLGETVSFTEILAFSLVILGVIVAETRRK